MPTISAPSELKDLLGQMADRVILSVSEKALSQLRETIRRDTYLFGGFPNKFYVMGTGLPTFEFLRAWKWRNVKTSVSERVRELFYEYFSMTFDPENYIHGSVEHGDRREALAKDLNVSGIALNSDFGGKERRPYWDNYIDEILYRGQLTKWFDEELLQFGFIKK